VNLGSFRILLPFFLTSWSVGVLNSAIFKLIRMLEWNTKHFPLNLHSGLTLLNFRDVGGGFELWNQIRHCKTVSIKRNLYLINYNRMRTQWTIKRNWDAGSSCLCDRGLHRYLRNFGEGGFEHPKPPLGTPLILPFAKRSVKWSLHCKCCGYLVYLRPILILSYPLLEGLSNGLFTSCLVTN